MRKSTFSSAASTWAGKGVTVSHPGGPDTLRQGPHSQQSQSLLDAGSGSSISTSHNHPVCRRPVAPSCLTRCGPKDCSPPGPSVCGISQAGILEWAAVSFSRGSFQPRGSNLGLLHWQADSLPLSHQGSSIALLSPISQMGQLRLRELRQVVRGGPARKLQS